MSNKHQDQIIKQKLLVDGEGTFEDKKLNDLAKNIMNFAENPNDENLEFDLDKVLGQIESNGVRNCVIMKMLDNEKAKLNQLNFTEQIAENKMKVEQNTIKLAKAKEIRKCEEEADALAAVVEQVPTIAQTNEKMENLKEHFKIVEEQEKKVDEKFENRKRDFFGLVASAHQLQSMLKEDKA